MASIGSVRGHDAEEGWGIIDGVDVPDGCWVHLSAVAADGYRRLVRGQVVFFRAEPVAQDGYAFRAVKVWTDAAEPPGQTQARLSPNAYHTSLTLTFESPQSDDRTDT